MNYRITKYNPNYRNDKGAYLREEWISVYDIEKSFGSTKLTRQHYIEIEELYINAACCLYASSGKPDLYMKKLEKQDREYAFLDKYNLSYSKDVIAGLHDGMLITDAELFMKICKMCLRSILWCKLESYNGFYIHFGYDYYMYVGGIPDKINIDNCKREGIYVEEFLSPYITEKI
jgi:hypothetical protein